MQLINEQSVFPRLSAQSSTEVITILGNALREQGIVTERYVDEVLAREKVFPTGLQVDDLGVGIPHTNPNHVIKSGIAVATLKEPVIFQSMVDAVTPIKVNLVFLLAIKAPNGQVNILQELMSIIQDTALLNNLLTSEKENEISAALVNLKL